jgi:hypothetical protein
MAFKLLDLRIVIGKLEVTAGTAETLTAADFNTRCFAPEVSPIFEVDDEGAKFATGDHGETTSIIGAQSGTISFTEKLAWGGAVTTIPNWFKWFNACGYETQTYTSTGIGLWPKKSCDCQSMTMWVIDIDRCYNPKGLAYKFAGCVGTVEFGCDGIGKPISAKFTFTGKLTEIADLSKQDLEALNVLTSPDTELPDKLLNTTLTFGATSFKISSYKLTAGNAVTPIINQADVTGYDTYGISARKPRFSCNPLAGNLSSNEMDNVYTRITEETTGALVLTMQNMIIKAPVAQLLSATVANREGLVSWDENWKLCRNGTSDSDLDDECTHEILIGTKS